MLGSSGVVKRWPIVVGIAAICGGIAWFALRRPAAPAMAPARSKEIIASSSPGKAAIGAPLPPILDAIGSSAGVSASGTPSPVLPEGSPAPNAWAEVSPAVTFAGQDRDLAWAPTTEAEIKRRFTAIRGARLESTECRQDQCMIVIAGTQDDLGNTLAAIEEPRGLHGFAETILLTAPEQRNGQLVLRAYAKFAR